MGLAGSLALGGIDLSVVGCDLCVEGDVVVELVLVAVLESDLLLREGLVTSVFYLDCLAGAVTGLAAATLTAEG